jgi:uncharacterized protein (TIGR04255 family)
MANTPIEPTSGRPPLVEALVDIQVICQPEFDIACLLDLLSAEDAMKFSTAEPLAEITFSYSGGSEGRASADQRVIGYRYFSIDRSRALQLRKNGFAFSQLRPYPATGWAEWSIEAKRLWRTYLQHTQPVRVSRLAVRYINRVVVAATASSAKQYFSAFPHLPDTFGEMNGFLMQAEISPVSAPTSRLKITQATIENSDAPEATTFLLDLDAYRTESLAPDSDEIWRILDQLHEIITPSFEQLVSFRLQEHFHARS